MIVTDHFVLLNYPKTGSSFARKIIKEAFQNRLNMSGIFNRLRVSLGLAKNPCLELLLPNYLANRPESKHQHGVYSQIPNQYLDRPIYSVMRNPYEKFLSGYEYKFYAKKPRLPIAILKDQFPKFPELSLDEYVVMMKMINENDRRSESFSVGVYTQQFIKMFFKHPEQTLNTMTPSYFESGEYKKDLPELNWLQQENLTNEIFSLLENSGFEPAELEFIKSTKWVNVTQRKEGKRSDLWTQSAIDYIQQEEKYLLLMLEEMGFQYAHSNID